MFEEINRYLSSVKAERGMHPANSNESPLGSYFSFRQDHIKGSPKATDPNLPDYIPALDTTEDSDQQAHNIAAHKAGQEEFPLYKLLASKLDGSAIPLSDKTHTKSLTDLVKTSVCQYRDYTSAHCRFSLLHRHGKTGRINAMKLKYRLMRVRNIKEFPEIIS